MPKTITLHYPHPAGALEVAIDVDAVGTFAELIKHTPQREAPSKWTNAALFAFDDNGYVVITPRGEDLLASAHLLPEDPAPPKPEPPKCRECKGEGRFPLFVSFVDCETCGGTGTLATDTNASTKAAVQIVGGTASGLLGFSRFAEGTENTAAHHASADVAHLLYRSDDGHLYLGFGEYVGQRLSSTPDSYLNLLLTRHFPLAFHELVRYELDSRTTEVK